MADNPRKSIDEPATVSRRTFLRGTLAAAAVLGFDPQRRSWATAAEWTGGGTKLADGFPRFDGEIVTDGAALSAAADDFGHAIHRRPRAVLRPGSIRDIARLIDFARRHDIQVAARGQGHSTLGRRRSRPGWSSTCPAWRRSTRSTRAMP